MAIKAKELKEMRAAGLPSVETARTHSGKEAKAPGFKANAAVLPIRGDSQVDPGPRPSLPEIPMNLVSLSTPKIRYDMHVLGIPLQIEREGDWYCLRCPKEGKLIGITTHEDYFATVAIARIDAQALMQALSTWITAAPAIKDDTMSISIGADTYAGERHHHKWICRRTTDGTRSNLGVFEARDLAASLVGAHLGRLYRAGRAQRGAAPLTFQRPDICGLDLKWSRADADGYLQAVGPQTHYSLHQTAKGWSARARFLDQSAPDYWLKAASRGSIATTIVLDVVSRVLEARAAALTALGEMGAPATAPHYT
jgi:hypothetical protein